MVFKEGWQNKHAASGTEIRADFLIEGKGKATVARTWPAGSGLAGSSSWLQVAGEKRVSIDGLGWGSDLRTSSAVPVPRRSLSRSSGWPSELHDLLASVLGLDELTNAAARLNTARKQRDDALTAVKQRLEPLKERLAAIDDERTRACLDALKGRTWAHRGRRGGGHRRRSLPMAASSCPRFGNSRSSVRQRTTRRDRGGCSSAGCCGPAYIVAGTSAGQARQPCWAAGRRPSAPYDSRRGRLPDLRSARRPDRAVGAGGTRAPHPPSARKQEPPTRQPRQRGTAVSQALTLMCQPPQVFDDSAVDTVAGPDERPPGTPGTPGRPARRVGATWPRQSLRALASPWRPVNRAVRRRHHPLRRRVGGTGQAGRPMAPGRH